MEALPDREPVQFDDLDDYCIIHVFAYLDHVTLYHLSLISPRYSKLVELKALWVHINGGMAHGLPSCLVTTSIFLERMHAGTRTLRISGASNHNILMLDDAKLLFSPLQGAGAVSANITVMALENQTIMLDALKQLPSSLVELSLRKSFVCTPGFFRNCSELKHLRVMVLDECRWVLSNCLMSLSKLPSLEILSFYKCVKMIDEYSYINISLRFGFPKLHVLDVRYTDFGDEMIGCLSFKETLSEVYFSSYSGAFYADFERRAAQLLAAGDISNANVVPNCCKDRPQMYLHPLSDFDERCPRKFEEIFGVDREELWSHKMQSLTDEGVLKYRYGTATVDSANAAYESVLYKRPFTAKCTCACAAEQPDDCRMEDELPALQEIYHMVKPMVWDLDTWRTGAHSDLHPGDSSQLYVARLEYTHLLDMRLHTLQMRFQEQSNAPTMVKPADRNFESLTYDTYLSKVIAKYRGKVPMPERTQMPSTSQRDDAQDIEAKEAKSGSDNGDQSGNKGKSKKRGRPADDEADGGSGNNRKWAKMLVRFADSDESTSNATNSGAGPKLVWESQDVALNDRRDLCPRDVCPRNDVITINLRLDGNHQQFVSRPLRIDVDIVDLHNFHTGLRKLSLRGFRNVTDRCLVALECLDLLLLDVTHTSVTAAGARAFKTKNPECRIVHPALCRCLPNMHF